MNPVLSDSLIYKYMCGVRPKTFSELLRCFTNGIMSTLAEDGFSEIASTKIIQNISVERVDAYITNLFYFGHSTGFLSANDRRPPDAFRPFLKDEESYEKLLRIISHFHVMRAFAYIQNTATTGDKFEEFLNGASHSDGDGT